MILTVGGFCTYAFYLTPVKITHVSEANKSQATGQGVRALSRGSYSSVH